MRGQRGTQKELRDSWAAPVQDAGLATLPLISALHRPQLDTREVQLEELEAGRGNEQDQGCLGLAGGWGPHPHPHLWEGNGRSSWRWKLLRKDCSPRAGAESLLLWVEHKRAGEAGRGGAKPQGLEGEVVGAPGHRQTPGSP